MAITPRSRPPLMDNQQLPPREPEGHSLPSPGDMPPPSTSPKIPIWAIPAFVALATGIFVATHVASAKSRASHARAASPFDTHGMDPTPAPTMEAGIPNLPEFEDEDAWKDSSRGNSRAKDAFIDDHCILYGSEPKESCTPLLEEVPDDGIRDFYIDFESRSYSRATDETTFTYNVCGMDSMPLSHVTIGHLGPCCVTRNSYFGDSTVGGLDTLTCTYGLSMDTAFTEMGCQIYTITYLGDVPQSKEIIPAAVGIDSEKFKSQTVVGADCRPPFELPFESGGDDDDGATGDGESGSGGSDDGVDGESGGEKGKKPNEVEFDFNSMFGEEGELLEGEKGKGKGGGDEGDEFNFEAMFEGTDDGTDTPEVDSSSEFPWDTMEIPQTVPSAPTETTVSTGSVQPVPPSPSPPVVEGANVTSVPANATTVATKERMYRTVVVPVPAIDVQPMTKTALYSEAIEDCTPKPDISYQSKSNQDEALKEIYYSNPYKCDGVVVEIGSVHKYSASFYFEYAMNWNAFLFAGSPRSAKELKSKRQSATVSNGAFCTFQGTPDASQDSLTWVQGKTESEDVFVKSSGSTNTVFSEKIGQADTSGPTETVPCINLTEEVTKAGHSHIDILFISVAGEPYSVLRSLNFDELSLSILVVEKDPTSLHYEDMYSLLTNANMVKAEWDVKRWCSSMLGSCADNEVWIEKVHNPLPVYGSSNGRRLLEALEAKPRLYDPVTGRRNHLRQQ